METKINIAEILKNKPENTKLYSPVFGDVYLLNIDTKDIIVKHHGSVTTFYHNGKLYEYDKAEPLLFPSKEMRDWSKFAWKKGDVLAGAFDVLCIFEKWANADYTKFDSKFVTQKNRGTTFEIEDWYKVTNKAVIKQYISDIEEKLGGKLNRETLKIENAQPEFKDGDVVVVDATPSEIYSKCILAALVVASLFASCSSEKTFRKKDGSTITAKPYGWASKENKVEGVNYELNAPDVVASIIFAQSVIAPVLLTAYDVWEPVSYTEPSK